MTGIERIGFYNPWLYPFVAEAAKTEISKMTGTATENTCHIRQITTCRKANLDLKRVEPVKETSAVGGIKRVSKESNGFKERTAASYSLKLESDEKGRNIDISFLLWYEIALGFLGAFLLALYLDFDFIESIFLAILGSALGVYFHEMHHFVTARRLILEKKLHKSLPHGVGLFHRELIKALKGEPSNSYIRVNINKRGIGVVYPQEPLTLKEILKANRSGSRANARFLISFAILGVLFHLAFTVIAFPSFVQGMFSTFREGMKKK